MERTFCSGSGIEIKEVYAPEDLREFDHARDLGMPGAPPLTRGIHKNMYRGRPWSIRRYSGFGTPEETNKLYKTELEMGQTGLSIAVDHPTSCGLDSDNPKAIAEVGVAGVSVDSLLDMEIMFEGIPLEKVATAIISGPFPSAPLTAMYFLMAEKQGIDIKRLRGTSYNDVMGVGGYLWRPDQIAPRHQLRIIVDCIEWCSEVAPNWHPVNFDSYNYREQGINAVQELGMLLANAIGYIEEEKRRGRIPLDNFIRSFSFNMGAHNDFFEEIAKLRAGRRMWYAIARDRYGTEDPRCWQFRLHVQSSGCTHTTQEPYNNLIRIAYQVLSAVLGGAQSVHGNAYDEGLCLPTEESMLLSIRTQQLLQHETNVINTVDPLGGSYYIESLTNEIEKRAWEYMKEIERAGGIVSAIETGWIQSEFKKAMLEHERRVNSAEVAVVGVNLFKLPREPYKVPIFRPDLKAPEVQVERLERVRRERDTARVTQALRDLRQATLDGENVMPGVMEAVKAYATLGEICDTWREAQGIWECPMRG